MPEPEQKVLPMFPLKVVLFPRTPLPLHIFEERYRRMVAAALEGEGLFGVICAGSDEAVRVGCCAKIAKTIKRYDDGRLDILTVGVQRFRITRLLPEETYMQAQVSYFRDAAGDDLADLPDLVDRCLQLFYYIYDTMPGNLPLSELEQTSATVASFYLAYFSDLSLTQKQRLLELTDPETRLKQLRAALEQRKREQLEQLDRTRQIQSNGHLPSQ